MQLHQLLEMVLYIFVATVRNVGLRPVVATLNPFGLRYFPPSAQIPSVLTTALLLGLWL